MGIKTTDGKPIWGILGGLGPLASAAFLQTIYEQSPERVEQRMPACVLISDPSFPDRTTRFLRGEYDELTQRLETALETLVGMGAEKLFIACVTIHAILPRVSRDLRARTTSLLEVVAKELEARGDKHLLASTLGTYELGLFEDLPGGASRWLVVPEEGDRKAIHELIYEIKAGAPLEEPLDRLQQLLDRYGVESFVAGCTELHLLTRRLPAHSGLSYIDPLDIVARRYIS